MKRALFVVLAVALIAPRSGWSKGKKDADDDSDKADDSDDDAPKKDADAPTKDKKKSARAKAKAKAKDADADSDSDSDSDKDSDKDKASSDKDAPDNDKPDSNTLAEKQDLTGHDLGATKKANEFERDRFFVDKTDTEKTQDTTLIQGSLTLSAFLYTETGGNYPTLVTGGPPGANGPGSDAAAFSRYFTDLRLQTDFRHIKASRWDARVDARIRVVNTPEQTPFDATANGTGNVTPVAIQSGLNGQNEYEIRELWLIRNGERTDVIIGRQFIPDLAAVKIDGLRIDYASSKEFTYLGFAGLYPVRGSRSITTDYVALKNDDGTPAGTFVGAGGFGAAYRTSAAYGSIGGVVLYPLQGEEPRVFATSTGYWRYGSKLDFYHFALIDLISSYGGQFTNLSGGVNYKPTPRLRMTASFNRVDTDTLNVQANAFLSQPNGTSVVQNEVYLQRLSTDQLRGSISAGLGPLQRFEITVASAFRYRPAFELKSPDGTTEVANLPAAEGVEIYGSIIDRHSFKDARIGVDAVRTFGVGSVAYQRSEVSAFRVFAAHDVKDGRGEIEGEISYATTKDSIAPGTTCNTTLDLANCFGATSGAILSAGGTLYYRFNRDWFGIASIYLSRTTLTAEGATAADPSITGFTGFGRIAYRF